jgi:hypothetical protein
VKDNDIWRLSNYQKLSGLANGNEFIQNTNKRTTTVRPKALKISQLKKDT